MSSTDEKMGTSGTSDPPTNPASGKKFSNPGRYLEVLRQSLADSAGKSYRTLPLEMLIKKHSELKLKPLTGKNGLDRTITTPHLQRIGLALTGYEDDLLPGGLAWLGDAETHWLRDQPLSAWAERPQSWAQKNLAGLLVSHKAKLPDSFVEKLNEAGLPLLGTKLSITEILGMMPSIMDEHLSPQICFHGNLLAISGFGVLILGRSGIGKSDDALDLILHGHQLVADDTVQVYRNPLGKLIGKADELTRHHLTIRGLGIINIKELFGVTAILERHPIDLVLYLEAWDEEKRYTLQHKEELEILGVTLPLMRIPVSEGRNLNSLITVAVKTHELRTMGYDAEKRLTQKLRKRLRVEQKSQKNS